MTPDPDEWTDCYVVHYRPYAPYALMPNPPRPERINIVGPFDSSQYALVWLHVHTRPLTYAEIVRPGQ